MIVEYINEEIAQTLGLFSHEVDIIKNSGFDFDYTISNDNGNGINISNINIIKHNCRSYLTGTMHRDDVSVTSEVLNMIHEYRKILKKE